MTYFALIETNPGTFELVQVEPFTKTTWSYLNPGPWRPFYGDPRKIIANMLDKLDGDEEIVPGIFTKPENSALLTEKKPSPWSREWPPAGDAWVATQDYTGDWHVQHRYLSDVGVEILGIGYFSRGDTRLRFAPFTYPPFPTE
jgi:hypothetical protein